MKNLELGLLKKLKPSKDYLNKRNLENLFEGREYESYFFKIKTDKMGKMALGSKVAMQ